MAYNSKKNGAANYNSWMQLTDAQIAAIVALEGTDKTNDPKLERFANVVFLAGSTDAGVPGSVANPSVVQIGGIANTGVPAPVDDGDTVSAWFNEYGQLVPAGYNSSSDTIDVTVTNDPMSSRLGPITNIDAVGTGATYEGEWVNLSLFHNATFQMFISGITVGQVDVIIDHSLDGTNAVEKYNTTFSKNSSVEVAFSNVAMRYVRVRFDNRTDGTITALIYAGN